ncbi:MAG: hypothetical protein IJD45_02965 [Clostridia bacterium]|nr:hypothetical protein [Clostridia bacterium]
MKSNIFRKVINEEYIEINKSVSKTIEQLCELYGTVRESLPFDAKVIFDCSKKGKIKLRTYMMPGLSHRRPDRYFPLHKIYGRVISKDNKTYVKIISVYNRLNLCFQYLLLSSGVLLDLIYILITIPKERFVPAFFIPFTILITIGTIATLCRYTPKSQQKKRDLVLLSAMRDEIIKRIKMIEAWPD